MIMQAANVLPSILPCSAALLASPSGAFRCSAFRRSFLFRRIAALLALITFPFLAGCNKGYILCCTRRHILYFSCLRICFTELKVCSSLHCVRIKNVVQIQPFIFGRISDCMNPAVHLIIQNAYRPVLQPIPA